MSPEMEMKKLCLEKRKGGIEAAYLHEKQAAAYLNVSVQFLRKCRSKGTGPEWVKFGFAVRYPILGLARYVEASRRQFTGQYPNGQPVSSGPAKTES